MIVDPSKLQQVIDKWTEFYGDEHARLNYTRISEIARDLRVAYELGQASQRERDAPYMQHKKDCKKITPDQFGYDVEGSCSCGLDAIRSSSLTEKV